MRLIFLRNTTAVICDGYNRVELLAFNTDIDRLFGRRIFFRIFKDRNQRQPHEFRVGEHNKLRLCKNIEGAVNSGRFEFIADFDNQFAKVNRHHRRFALAAINVEEPDEARQQACNSPG